MLLDHNVIGFAPFRRKQSQLLWLISHQRLKPFFEIFNRHLLTVPVLDAAVNGLRWNEHIAHDVDDAIRRNAILDRDGREAVNLDVDVTAIAGDVHAERFVFKKSLEVDLDMGY